jgi:hypothetical protein
MKSAYELAMERLKKASPTVTLSDKQKKEIAELESVYAAKIAQRELMLQEEMEKAASKGDDEALEQVRKQMASNRKTLQAELEEKKEKVRTPKK